MTGAGGLSSDHQPVTAKPIRPLTLMGALRGLPAEGGASATAAPTRGKAFPSKAHRRNSPYHRSNRLRNPMDQLGKLVRAQTRGTEHRSQLAGAFAIFIRQLDLTSHTPAERSSTDHNVSD
jgi:hypothetical protein